MSRECVTCALETDACSKEPPVWGLSSFFLSVGSEDKILTLNDISLHCCQALEPNTVPGPHWCLSSCSETPGSMSLLLVYRREQSFQLGTNNLVQERTVKVPTVGREQGQLCP